MNMYININRRKTAFVFPHLMSHEWAGNLEYSLSSYLLVFCRKPRHRRQVCLEPGWRRNLYWNKLKAPIPDNFLHPVTLGSLCGEDRDCSDFCQNSKNNLEFKWRVACFFFLFFFSFSVHLNPQLGYNLQWKQPLYSALGQSGLKSTKNAPACSFTE